MLTLVKLLLFAETLLWYGWIIHTILLDNMLIRQRENTAAWKQHFKENVASSWIFTDGLGH